MEDTAEAIANLTRERWEANAEYWVRVIREGRDRYRTDLTDAAVLDAVGACPACASSTPTAARATWPVGSPPWART